MNARRQAIYKTLDPELQSLIASTRLLLIEIHRLYDDSKSFRPLHRELHRRASVVSAILMRDEEWRL